MTTNSVCALLPARYAPNVMKTSVNSDTWIKVGSNMPSTASDEPFAAMMAVTATATTVNTALCAAVVVVNSAQATNAIQMTKPNQDALSISAASTATPASPNATLRCGRKYLRSCSQEISVK